MAIFFRSGSYATDVIGDFIFLWGKITTSGNVSHLRKNFATVGYQVTAGKTLYLVKIKLFPMVGGDAVNLVKIGYADNDVGLDTTTARTNPVMAIGLDDTVNNGIPIWGAISTTAPPHSVLVHGDESFGLLWPIAAASKFPFVRAIGGGFNPPNTSIIAWCIEA